MSNPTNNYIGSFHFRITVEGINDPLDGFVKISSIESKTETMEFQHGLDIVTRKAAGRTNWSPVTLTRVYSGLDEFHAWRKQVEAGNIDRRSVTIEYLRNDHSLVRKYVLLNAYPEAWKISEQDAGSSNPATEEIILAVEQVLQLE